MRFDANPAQTFAPASAGARGCAIGLATMTMSKIITTPPGAGRRRLA